MKLLYIIFTSLFILPILSGCQADTPYDDIKSGTQSTQTLTIKAVLPASQATRAQVTYCNPNQLEGEIFMWNEKDEIFLYNIY